MTKEHIIPDDDEPEEKERYDSPPSRVNNPRNNDNSKIKTVPKNKSGKKIIQKGGGH